MSEIKKLSRELIGRVVSDKMDKTIVVEVTRQVKHPIYGKYIRRSTKVHANDPQNLSKVGDTVLIEEIRPLSKTKNWNLKNILEEASGFH